MKINAHEVIAHTVAAWQTVHFLSYIDPGTGSYAYQIVIAGVTGLLFFFTTIKRKFVSLFSKSEPTPQNIETPSKDALAPESKDHSAVQRN